MIRLERECRSYAQYLAGRPPDDYLLRKYIECHKIGRIAEPEDAFDRFLTRTAARGPFLARAADTYASRFLKYGSLRKKLVLVLALLECSPGWFETLDRVEPGGVPGTVARLAWRTGTYLAMLLFSLALFLPVRLWLGVFRSPSRSKAPAVEV